MSLELRIYPDPILKQQCAPVADDLFKSKHIADLVTGMKMTLKREKSAVRFQETASSWPSV